MLSIYFYFLNFHLILTLHISVLHIYACVYVYIHVYTHVHTYMYTFYGTTIIYPLIFSLWNLLAFLNPNITIFIPLGKTSSWFLSLFPLFYFQFHCLFLNNVVWSMCLMPGKYMILHIKYFWFFIFNMTRKKI